MNENHVTGEIGCQHVQESDSEFWRLLTLLGLFFYCFESDKDSCHWFQLQQTMVSSHELFFVSTKTNLHPEMLKSISLSQVISILEFPEHNVLETNTM